VTRDTRELLADWLIVGAAVSLFGSLFLTWSHQFSSTFAARWGQSVVLRDAPHNPTAWQVYSIADVLLALLAGALLALALAGGRRARLGGLAAAAIALAFTAHALSVPPTNGALIAASGNAPTAGVGETVAIAALCAAIAGLVLSFTAE
jgi:hypothetical protein